MEPVVVDRMLLAEYVEGSVEEEHNMTACKCQEEVAGGTHCGSRRKCKNP